MAIVLADSLIKHPSDFFDHIRLYVPEYVVLKQRLESFIVPQDVL